MKTKFLIPIFLIFSSFVAVPNIASKAVLAAGNDNVTIFPTEDAQLSHCRIIKETIQSTEQELVSTNWSYDYVPDLESADASYIRLVVNAPSEGSYKFNYEFFGVNYKFKCFVNGNLENESTATGSSSSLTKQIIILPLKEGKNVVITQINNWGGIRSIGMSSTLTIDKYSEEYGPYYFAEATNTVSPLYFDDSMFSKTEIPSVGPLHNDNNDEYISKNTFNIKSHADTKSLDLTYFTDKGKTDDSYINISINDGLKVSYPLEYTEGVLTTTNISTSDLTKMGFNFGEGVTNKVIITPANSSANYLYLNRIELSDKTGGIEVLKEVTANELKNKSILMGRSLESVDTIPLDWSASNIQFDINGEGNVYLTGTSHGGANIVVEVDGNPRHYTFSEGSSTMKIAKNLFNGVHHIRIMKQSEANGSLFEINKLSINEAATISKPDTTFDYKFEFYGDSTCCANQIGRDGTEDAYYSFSRILSDKYNAEWQNVCVSGRGLYSGHNAEDPDPITGEIGSWPASHERQINKLYKYTSWYRSNEELWDFSSYIPDVLVVDLGNNDLGHAIMEELDFTVDDFTTELKRWHKEVRTLYSGTKIIYLYGLYENRDFEDEYRAAIEELKSGGDNGVEFLYVPYLGQGKDSHPNYVEHEYLSCYLSEVMSNMLGVENPFGVTTRIEAEDASITGRYVRRTNGHDWERWSDGVYIGNAGPEKPVANASQITDDGETLKLFSFAFEAPTAGRYGVRVAYATDGPDSTIYYKVGNANTGSFSSVEFKSSEGWATPLSYSNEMIMELAQGNNEIIITGPSTDGSWANYDYIQITKLDDNGKNYISAPYSPLYTYENLPISVEDGENISFKVNTTEYCSQTKNNLEIYVDGSKVTPDESGNYNVNNIQNNIVVDVRGVLANLRRITYKYNGSVIKTVEVRVFDVIPSFSLENRNHYRFKGWSPELPGTMVNEDLEVEAVYVYDESIVIGPNVGLIIGVIAGILVIAGGITAGVVISKKKKRGVLHE